jgi:hypothetical protein
MLSAVEATLGMTKQQILTVQFVITSFYPLINLDKFACVCWQRFLEENKSKKDKESQPMKNRVQSADWRKKENGQHDSPMVRGIQPW